MEPPIINLRNDIPPDNVDVLMVGAGPVGLWTATQVKILLPDIEVMLLDKYQQPFTLGSGLTPKSKAPPNFRKVKKLAIIPTH